MAMFQIEATLSALVQSEDDMEQSHGGQVVQEINKPYHRPLRFLESIVPQHNLAYSN